MQAFFDRVKFYPKSNEGQAMQKIKQEDLRTNILNRTRSNNKDLKKIIATSLDSSSSFGVKSR